MFPALAITNKASMNINVQVFSVFFLILFLAALVLSSLLFAGFLQLRQAGATLHCGAWASYCGGFSRCQHGLQACGLSTCGTQALECRLSSCGAWAQLLYGMWDLPRPGIEPVSPALAGKFSTTAPPGKSNVQVFVCAQFSFPWDKCPRVQLLGHMVSVCLVL